MIYHLTTQAEWTAQALAAAFLPPDYSREGFIHCCTTDQLQGVLDRYFKGVPDILVLHLDESKLTASLKYEVATHDELFPHLFGPINKDAIIKIETLPTHLG